MHLENLKRWHWMAVSIVIGLVMAYVYAGAAAEGGGNRRTMGVSEFLRKIGRTTADAQKQQIPLVRNVRIYPPVENKNLVTLEELVVTNDKDGKGQGEYQTRQLVTEIPFALTRQKPPTNTWTIQDELAKQKQRNPKVEFTYAKLAETPYVYGICVGGSFLLIGVLWPSVLMYLQTAGYGPAAKPADDRTIDLSKVRSGNKSKPTAAPIKAGPTKAQMDQLDAVTANYEQKIGHAAANMPAAAGGKPAAAASAGPTRNWDAGPEEARPAGPVEEPDDIEVKGEYYPVLIHHKKPTDEKKSS